MKNYLLWLVDKVLDGDWYMNFHWLVLIGLWICCLHELWNHDFGNVLALSAMIAVWKMKGVEE